MCIINDKPALTKLRSEKGYIYCYKVVNRKLGAIVFSKLYKQGWNYSNTKRSLPYGHNCYTSRGIYAYYSKKTAKERLYDDPNIILKVKIFTKDILAVNVPALSAHVVLAKKVYITKKDFKDAQRRAKQLPSCCNSAI